MNRQRLEEDLSVQRRILRVHLRQAQATAEKVRSTSLELGVMGVPSHMTAGLVQFRAAERLLSDRATAQEAKAA